MNVSSLIIVTSLLNNFKLWIEKLAYILSENNWTVYISSTILLSPDVGQYLSHLILIQKVYYENETLVNPVSHAVTYFFSLSILKCDLEKCTYNELICVRLKNTYSFNQFEI